MPSRPLPVKVNLQPYDFFNHANQGKKMGSVIVVVLVVTVDA